MSAVVYEITAYGRVYNGRYEEHPHAVVASGRLTATTTTPSAVVTVPGSDHDDDRLILRMSMDNTGAPGDVIPYLKSYVAFAPAGQTPKPDAAPRIEVNGIEGAVTMIVRPGQRFAILDTGKAFGDLKLVVPSA